MTWLAHVRSDRGELREAVLRLFSGTVLHIESEFDQAEATFTEAVQRWMDDYDPLIETWREAARPSQAAAVRYQAMSLYQTTVIESLSDAQFLPRYGFPIGLLKLRVVVKEDRQVREEDQFRLDQKPPPRSLFSPPQYAGSSTSGPALHRVHSTSSTACCS